MGHERIGILPRRRRWSKVVEGMAAAALSREETEVLAAKVLKNVSSRFLNIASDSGVQAAFGFLIGLVAPLGIRGEKSGCVPEVDLDNDPSPLQLVADLQRWVDGSRQSQEYSSLAVAAASDAIAIWTKQTQAKPSLFRDRDTASEIWNRASSGGGFSEVTRLFLAKFTERYLNYFLEREASAALRSLGERNSFSAHVRDHVQNVSLHAFETAKIAQSFAAGWFNRHVKNQIPRDTEIKGFLGLCFSKLHEELVRETL